METTHKEMSNAKKRKTRPDESAPFTLLDNAKAGTHRTNKSVKTNRFLDDGVMRAMTQEESRFLKTDVTGKVYQELLKLGFLYTSRNVYAHPDITDQTFESPEAVGRYLVSHGIPNVGLLDDDEAVEKEAFLWWVRSTNIDRNDLRSAMNNLNGLTLVDRMPTDDHLIKLLTGLGFHRDGDRFYVPGASKVSDCQHEHGVHYFVGLPKVRQYIRGAETLGAKGANIRCSSRSTVDKASLLLVRAWAATSPAPLPVFALAGTDMATDTAAGAATATVENHFDFADEADTEAEVVPDAAPASAASVAVGTGNHPPVTDRTSEVVEMQTLENETPVRKQRWYDLFWV
jgi:hypothetical protein